MSMGWVNFVGWFCFIAGVMFGAVGMAIYIGIMVDREQRKAQP